MHNYYILLNVIFVALFSNFTSQISLHTVPSFNFDLGTQFFISDFGKFQS